MGPQSGSHVPQDQPSNEGELEAETNYVGKVIETGHDDEGRKYFVIGVFAEDGDIQALNSLLLGFGGYFRTDYYYEIDSDGDVYDDQDNYPDDLSRQMDNPLKTAVGHLSALVKHCSRLLMLISTGKCQRERTKD